MKKLKKRIPLKYIYVLSAIIAILLSVGLYLHMPCLPLM